MKVDFQDIIDIYDKEVRKNTKNKAKIYRFERFKMQNLTNVYNVLTNNSYKYVKYNIFLIKHPKYRVVMSLDIKDKIINHYVTRFILMPKLEKYLDIRNVATRKNMGRDYALRLIKKDIEHFKYKDCCYVLKLDIKKFFYNINHQVLKDILKDELTEEERNIVNVIIDSTDYDYINNSINKLKEKEIINNPKRRKEIEEMPPYSKGKGLPIGNMTSQFLSIFYLNKLDHDIVNKYHLKYFCKYMDDYIIFSENKEYLKEIKLKIETTLNDEYRLNINSKKTKITSITEGFSFCGYRFRIIDNKTVINVCASTRNRVKKRIKEVKYLYINNYMSLQSTFCSISTYYNGFKFGSRKKMQRLVENYFFKG